MASLSLFLDHEYNLLTGHVDKEHTVSSWGNAKCFITQSLVGTGSLRSVLHVLMFSQCQQLFLILDLPSTESDTLLRTLRNSLISYNLFN